MFRSEESKRLKILYAQAVLRATILEYLLTNKGYIKNNITHFATFYEKDELIQWSIKLVDFKKEISFLHNLHLIEYTENDGLKITAKGYDSVEKGVYWDRMKTLTVDLRTHKTQLISLTLSVIAAAGSVSLLIIKALER